jgi:hypothetical protein
MSGGECGAQSDERTDRFEGNDRFHDNSLSRFSQCGELITRARQILLSAWIYPHVAFGGFQLASRVSRRPVEGG